MQGEFTAKQQPQPTSKKQKQINSVVFLLDFQKHTCRKFVAQFPARTNAHKAADRSFSADPDGWSRASARASTSLCLPSLPSL